MDSTKINIATSWVPFYGIVYLLWGCINVLCVVLGPARMMVLPAGRPEGELSILK
jgi:hypothetical protein